MREARKNRGRMAVVFVASVFVLSVAASEASAEPTITEFGTGAGISMGAGPVGITEGPDGNIWFAETDIGAIGRITPAGVATEFTTGITPGAVPWAITAGPDGNVWYSDRAATELIGRVTPLGAVTEFPVSMPSDARDMVAGPDGNVWFTQPIDDKIAKITPAGVITEYDAGAGSSPESLAFGPDGNIWFTQPLADEIGVMDTTGVLLNEFSAGISIGANPQDITLGPDDALWFTEPGINSIGRITTAGVVSESGDILIDIPLGLQDITLGPDGKLWFTANQADRVGSMETNGEVTFGEITWYGTANGITPGAAPHGITTGPDDTIWFTERGISRVARITDIVDTTPPDTIIDSGPSGLIATNEVTFEFSGSPVEDTELFQCMIDGDEDFSECTSPLILTELDEGPHSVQIRAEDAAGNQDPTPATRTFTVDTIPPDTIIDSGPTGTITTNQATFAFRGSPAVDTSLIECRIDSGPFANCTSPRNFTSLANGSHTVDFRAVDAAGNRDSTPATRTFTVNVVPPVPPEPKPIAGKQLVVDTVAGKVKVKVPGTKKFVALEDIESIPTGSLVDTRKGTVELTSAMPGGKTQTARFKYGLFKVTQQKKPGAFTELKLAGRLACPRARGALLSSTVWPVAETSAAAGRRLWGRGKGKFTSKGKRGSGSARGTTWQVTDRCDGSTLIKSIQGRVTARDFVRKKSLILKTGKSYLARPKKR